jgi:hypothetical protein
MTREVRCRSPSLSRYLSPREKKVKSKRKRCHHRHLTRTWQT